MEDRFAPIIEFFQENGISILLALLIFIAGYFIALFLRWGIAAGINRTGLGAKAKATGGNLGRSIGQAAFYIALLFAAYLSLSQLGMGDYLTPIQDLLDSIGTFIPKLLGAGLVFFIGLMLARLAQKATESTLQAIQLDRLANKVGLSNITGRSSDLAKALGTIVFVLIIVPVAISALEILDVEAISIPLTSMLEQFLDFIPPLVAASAVLALAIFIGNWASNTLQNILPSFGFDNALRQVSSIDDGEPFRTPPSKVAGVIAFIVIIVIGLSAAVGILNIEALENILEAVLEIGGYLVLAGIILVIGMFVSTFLKNIVTSAGGNFAGNLIYIASIVLFGFMALSQLDFGENDGIVTTAFQYMLGAAAVAAGVGGAIAFGLGGREWAAARLQDWWPSKSKTAAKKAAPRKGSAAKK